jgi:hypothetical protein
MFQLQSHDCLLNLGFSFKSNLYSCSMLNIFMCILDLNAQMPNLMLGKNNLVYN